MMSSESLGDLVRILAERDDELKRLGLPLEGRLAEYGEQLDRVRRALDQEVLARQRVEESLNTVALRDVLTGLYNRGELTVLLREELARYHRSGRSMTLVIVDIDRFRELNEAHGDDAGDQILKWLARLLQDNVRLLDRCVRFGGDEFAIVSPETEETGAHQMCERLRQLAEEAPCQVESTAGGTVAVPVKLSMGIAGAPRAAATPDALVAAADEALHDAKARGGDGIAINFGRRNGGPPKPF